MKAIKSDSLKEITDSPDNRDKLRKFIVTRSSTSGRFDTSKGTSSTVEFVVDKPKPTKSTKPSSTAK